MVSTANLLADESEFHSGYRVFVQAVEMLSRPPSEQCELMGDYNVAWELKDDVRAGKYLVGLGYLTKAQEAWISALVGAMEGVPTQVLPAGADRETNLLAMQHPTWVPLRSIAAHVLEALKPITLENARYLRLV
ncbi:MAG: hypothetical protein V4542_14970 [Pseudomonadota bacterium]